MALAFVVPHEDVSAALAYWRARTVVAHDGAHG